MPPGKAAARQPSVLPKGPTSPETWAKLVEGENVDPGLIRQLVTELNEAQRHDDVIALIEQALIAGRVQPWMYEVLALTMEVAGRPRAQVERVLLSSRDVTPGDATALLFLGAYLARFERYPQAIECCRQAADLEPTRPEPYLEALRFGERSKSIETLAWAAPGVMASAWGPTRREAVDQAERAAAEVRSAWGKTGEADRLLAFEQALQAAQRIDLQIRLEFAGAGDLDLTIQEPGGTICSRDQLYTTAGGIFAHDGFGPQPENAFDEYLCPVARPGEYVVTVRHSWGTIVGKRARLIVTREAGTPQMTRELLPVTVSDTEAVFRIAVKRGRRQEVSLIPANVPVNRDLLQAAQGWRPGVPMAVAERRQLIARQLPPALLAQLAPGAPAVGPTVGGGGAVGYQPVVQFFNEGVMLSALATVSGDRRYVRISTQPVFSSITDVFTFSFVNSR